MINQKKLNTIGYFTAAITFLIASYIIFAYYQGFDGEYEKLGFLFIPVAFVVNSIVLIYILSVASKYKINGTLKSIFAMLLNIPVAFIYIWIAFTLMNYYRITLVNDTKTIVRNIQLYGCVNKKIQKIMPGESVTVWIELNQDCSLNISYLDNNKALKNDVVAGYLCFGMGQVESYHFSGNHNPKY